MINNCRSSIKSILLIVALILFRKFDVSAQNGDLKSLRDSMTRAFSVDVSKLPDSVAIYTFTVSVNLSQRDNLTKVDSISINDAIVGPVIKDVSELKKLDYSSIMGKRSNVKLMIPVVIIVYQTIRPSSFNTISFDDIMHQVAILYDDNTHFNLKGTEVIYVRPFITYASKAIYD